MNAKFVTMGILTLVILIGLSGCTDQKSTNINNDNQGNTNEYSGSIINDEFTIDENGGYYQSTGSEIYLRFDRTSVDEETKFFVNTIENFPDMEGAHFVVGYDFSPDGSQFHQAVNMQIIYDQNDVPDGVNEENLGIYLFENDELSEIDNCVCDPEYNTLTGKIHHFCQYMVCSYTPGGGPGGASGPGSGSGSNHSAVYTFEVPLEIHESSYKPTEDHGDLFTIAAWAMWDPQPYVRYYEVTLHFNGNDPEPYRWDRTWRERDTTWGILPWTQYVDNELFILGEHKYYPGHGKYIDIFDNYESSFPGKHGMGFAGIDDLFHDEKSAYWESEILTPSEILSYKNAMREFMQDYYKDWTVSVRAVT